MSTDCNTIDLALKCVNENNISASTNTINSLNALRNPLYTITLVGCFQVGKSTLLNKVFLGEEILLKQGSGLCTTAVMTKLVYGDRKRLTVFFRDENIPSQVYPNEEITEDLLARLTTVDDPDDTERQRKRSELAMSIKCVQLEYPCEPLKQYVFNDTPGVDDPNQELIDLTTLQFLRETDLVVLVVDASRQLDLYTKQFLARSVFQDGLSRVMIMASYRPQHDKSAEEREQILEAIRAELSQIGRGYIPVVSYTFDDGVEGDILRSPAAIRQAMVEYIDKNKHFAREERLAWYLRNDLIAAIEEIKARIVASTQNETEREELEKSIKSAVIKMDNEYNNTLNHFQSNFAKIKLWLNQEFDRQLLDEEDSKSVVRKFLAKFDNCGSLAEVRGEIDAATQAIKPEIDYVCADISKTAQEKIESILSEVSENACKAAKNVAITTRWGGDLNPGWAGKIHPTLVRAAEITLGFLLYGNVVGALAVFFANRIPLVKRLLPTEWLKDMVLKSLKQSFVKSIEAMKEDVSLQFDMSQQAVKDGIQEMFQEIYRIKIVPYQTQMSADVRTLSEDEIARLNRQIVEYSQLAEKLDSFQERS